tara:strand:- start:1601 stop:5716 length:4116 start_codon:yes stop_codon:yes gene_type:complete
MDIITNYFKHHKYPLTNHQIDSFKEFLRTDIPKIIKDANPIIMTKDGFKVYVYIGDDNSIAIDRPIANDEDGNTVLLTPKDARLRNLTYQTNIFANVKITIIETYKDDKGVDITKKAFEETFKNVAIATIPIMVHSDACVLYGQPNDVLRELGECVNDSGGYFIIDGKEKVLVSQEYNTFNVLNFKKIDDLEVPFSHITSISSQDDQGIPHNFQVMMYRKNDHNDDSFYDYVKRPGVIYVNIPKIKLNPEKKFPGIPLITLFAAYGVYTDKEIYQYIFGDDYNQEYVDFLQLSFMTNDPVIRHFFTPVNSNESFLRTATVGTEERGLENIKAILLMDVLPHINGVEAKLRYIGYMVQELYMFQIHNTETDMDGYIHKRVKVSGYMFKELFYDAYQDLVSRIRTSLDRSYTLGSFADKISEDKYKAFVNNDNIWRIIPHAFMSNTFMKSMKGMWAVEGSDDPELGIVQDLSRISYMGYLSHVRRVNMPLDRSLKLFKPHRLHLHQWGMVCPYETPDGEAIGYLKNLAILTRITSGTPAEDIMEALDASGMMVKLDMCSVVYTVYLDMCKIFVNGSWVGYTDNPINLTAYMKNLKRTGSINIMTGVAWNIAKNELNINTDSGRLMRPLLVVKNGSIGNIKGKTWFEALLGETHLKNKMNVPYNENIYTNKGFHTVSGVSDATNGSDGTELPEWPEWTGMIEYVDVAETDNSLIAMFPTDITKSVSGSQQRYTHCEIHPSTILSVVSANIPFSNHNFAARNLFHAAQSKQAIGIYATNFDERFDIASYIYHYPQKPIVSTYLSQLTKSDQMCNGFNIMVAVMSYSGFNQEDSLMINRGAIDRGFETISIYKSITATATGKDHKTGEELIFGNPKKMVDDQGNPVKVRGLKLNANYDLLDDNGFVVEGTYIPEGKDTVVIGMIMKRTVAVDKKDGMFVRKIPEIEYIDKSVVTDDNIYGYVDRIYVSRKTMSDTTKVAKLRFLKVRKLEFGDKHSSRHGQKGVVGRIFNEEDMPYTKDGCRPDLIMNPHAFPSRMTIGHIIECVFAKVCSQRGCIGDGTVFIDFDKDVIMNELEDRGFERNGDEVLYNGMTGEMIQSRVFFGPVYYFRLKHMVSDKINARGTGPYNYLTKQPTAGRRKKGGLRIGEMERDALIAHGASTFVKESMMERSDKATFPLSKNDGVISGYGMETDIVNIQTPHSFNLFMNEIGSMGIGTHMNVYDMEEIPSGLDEPIIEIKPELAKLNVTKREKQDDKPIINKKPPTNGDGKCTDIIKKKCEKEDKICNPETGRCVSKTGAIGKKLLKKGGDGEMEDDDVVDDQSVSKNDGDDGDDGNEGDDGDEVDDLNELQEDMNLLGNDNIDDDRSSIDTISIDID